MTLVIMATFLSVWYNRVMSKKTQRMKLTGLFGEIVRRKRRALEMSLDALAKHCKMDAARLSRIEHGERLPPELPRLMLMAEKLGIPLESAEFAEFLEAADRDRNPGLHQMANQMRGGKLWNPFAAERWEKVIACASLGELVAKATESAISRGAVEIAVRSQSGETITFRIVAKARRRKGKRR